jgi:hypothetical protein
VAVPSATVLPTAGGDGSDAAVVPATVTTYLVPAANCTSWPSVSALVLARKGFTTPEIVLDLAVAGGNRDLG